MATVTVIIPMYNKGELVGRSIRSILGQTFGDFRLIVVDDGSTDGGADIVARFDDERITLVRQANAGPGAARNAGIKAADTEYVAFLDADDEWYPWFLENSLKAIEEYGVPLVGSMYYRLPEGADMTSLAAKNGVEPGKYELSGGDNPEWASALISCFQPFNILARKEVLVKHGGFYDKGRCVLGEDQYLFLKIACCESFALIAPAAVRYHSEDSELGGVDRKRPMQPYLANPDEILAGCPVEKRKLISGVLELRAMRTACHMLGRGQRQEAAMLIKRFPGASEHKKLYHKLMRKFGLGPVYPAYLRLKKMFIRPLKTLLASGGGTGDKPMPLMPYEQADNDR